MEELDRKVEKAQIHLNQLNKRLKDVLTQVSKIVYNIQTISFTKKDRIDIISYLPSLLFVVPYNYSLFLLYLSINLHNRYVKEIDLLSILSCWLFCLHWGPTSTTC